MKVYPYDIDIKEGSYEAWALSCDHCDKIAVFAFALSMQQVCPDHLNEFYAGAPAYEADPDCECARDSARRR